MSKGYYNGNYNNNYNNQQQTKQIFKKSACKIIVKDGIRYISAWNVSKSRGLITLFAARTSKSKETKSKTGKTWINLMVTIKVIRTLQTQTYSGLFCKETEKLIIPDLQMVANPHAPSGKTRKGLTVKGYFGKYN